MARLIQVTKIGGWVYIDDDDTVKVVDSPGDVPAEATAFQLKHVSMDTTLYVALAKGAKESAEAIGAVLRSCLAGWRNVMDEDGNEIAFDRDLIDALPFNVLVALGNHVQAKMAKKRKEEVARRGNAVSGTSHGKKRSGGITTPGSRTASPATD